jgi:hypothetical protein
MHPRPLAVPLDDTPHHMHQARTEVERKGDGQVERMGVQEREEQGEGEKAQEAGGACSRELC